TLGLAAASMTQSTAGRFSKSEAFRTSPCRKVIPRERRMLRLVSLPGRTRLSIPIISHRGSRSRKRFARELATKPQIPVMRSLIAGNDNALPLRVKQLFLTFSARVIPMPGPLRDFAGHRVSDFVQWDHSEVTRALTEESSGMSGLQRAFDLFTASP